MPQIRLLSAYEETMRHTCVISHHICTYLVYMYIVSLSRPAEYGHALTVHDGHYVFITRQCYIIVLALVPVSIPLSSCYDLHHLII